MRLDLRILAATNQDLEQRVREGRFRADLVFRLNVAHVRMPALRERREDVPSLLAYYVCSFSTINGRNSEGYTDEAVEILKAYAWPGNVRELRNVVERQFLD